MEYQKFVSNQGWLSFYYPVEWTQFEEEEGTYLFLNNDNWNGNFRITPLHIKGKIKGFFKIQMFRIVCKAINLTKKNSEIIRLGNRKYLYYTDKFIENDDSLTMHYWIFVRKRYLITASFTIDTKRQNDEIVLRELEHCKKILKNIIIN